MRAEVIAWPEGLELDGDVRNTVVENEAVEHLRQLAEKVLFEALGSAARTPGLSDADLERARKAGVDLAPAARLRPWRPAVEGSNGTRARAAQPVQVGEDGLVVDFDAPQPAREGQMLYRAAARAGIAGRLFAPEPATRGQRWYATLPRIVDVRTKVRVGDETRDADDELAASWTADRRRVDAIVVEARIVSADGAERTMKLPTDVAIGGGREAFDVDDKAVVLAEDAQIDLDELTTLVMATSTGEGADSDSGERYGDFGMAAEYVAARALEDREAADRRQIARAVRNALMDRIRRDPDDEETIRIAIRGKDVEVSIENNQQS